MGILPNARHELFAQELARGKSGAEAYTAAGYRGDRTAASRLATNVNVQARVAELQNRGAERALVTVETITAELEEARQLANTNKQASAAVAAVLGKAKLHGLLVDRAESVNTNYNISDQPLTEDEWAEQHTTH